MKAIKYILTVRAGDRPGLLHLITGVLNRKLIPVVSLTAAPTDVYDIVLITMEVEASERALEPLLLKLENIVEVYGAEAVPHEEAVCLRSTFFKMDKEILSSPQAKAVSKWEAQIVHMDQDTVLLAKSGSETVIRRLYNELEGPYLMAFSQTDVITNSKLMGEGQSSVINRLAA